MSNSHGSSNSYDSDDSHGSDELNDESNDSSSSNSYLTLIHITGTIQNFALRSIVDLREEQHGFLKLLKTIETTIKKYNITPFYLPRLYHKFKRQKVKINRRILIASDDIKKFQAIIINNNRKALYYQECEKRLRLFSPRS